MSPMMASLGLRKGASFAPPPPPPALSYVGGSPAVYGTSAVDINVPAGVVAGDTIVACVMHRGTVTPPDGFELVIKQDKSEAGRAYDFQQSASVYIKVAEAADENGSFHFDLSAYSGVALVAVRHNRGWAATVEDVAAQWYVLGASPAARHPVPVVRSGGEGRIAISMSSCVYALTGGPSTDYDPPQGWTGVTAGSRVDNRLSVAYLEVGEGAIEEGLYHAHGDFANHDGVEIALVLSPEPLAYNYEVFLESGTWDWEAAGSPSHVDVLVVGGGGAGRYGSVGNVVAGGGGGAGGVVIQEGVAVTGDVAVVVGAGGPRTNAAPSSPGGDSSFGDVVAIGGGHGGISTTATAGDGGSGGGGSYFGGAGSGTPGQGNDGANAITNFNGARGGGGGGAKTAGRQGEANVFTGGGGDGYFLSELGWGAAVRFGAPAWIAGGGGGGSYAQGQGSENERAGPGGIGGGGWGGFGGHVNASYAITGDGFDAQPNTGSGGGAGGTNNTNNIAPRYGGAGGSGLVIVRWLA